MALIWQKCNPMWKMVLLVLHERTVIATFLNENILKNSEGYTNAVGRIKGIHKLNFALTSRSRQDHITLP